MKSGDIEYEFAWTCPKCKCHSWESETFVITDLGALKICCGCKAISE